MVLYIFYRLSTHWLDCKHLQGRADWLYSHGAQQHLTQLLITYLLTYNYRGSIFLQTTASQDSEPYPSHRKSGSPSPTDYFNVTQNFLAWERIFQGLIFYNGPETSLVAGEEIERQKM